MSDLITNPITNGSIGDPSQYIRPVVHAVPVYVDGFTLALTTFILGGIFILITCAYVVFKLFGQPMAVAAKDGNIIQHFDTPKSARMKDALITGGACRYRNMRDGTLSVTTKSTLDIEGKTGIVSFAGLGISIPIPYLAAMTKIINEGISPKKLSEQPKDKTVISGYNFGSFNELVKQIKNKLYIPIQIEVIDGFVTKNISADFTEKKVKIMNEINKSVTKDKFNFDVLIYVLIGFGLPFLTYMVVYK